MDPHELLTTMLETIDAEARLRTAFTEVDFKTLRGERTQTSMSYSAQVPQSQLSKMEKGDRVSMSLETMTRVLLAYLAVERVAA